MKPTIDIRGEHSAITIIIEAMKKMVIDIRNSQFIDSYRIVQIIDFLHTFNENCHNEKEEKLLFPTLLKCNIPWTFDLINHLVNEHKKAQVYFKDIDNKFEEYLSGNAAILESLCTSMSQYVEIEEYHIRTVDNVILPLCDRVFNPAIEKKLLAEFRNIQDRNVGSVKHMEYYKLLITLFAENDIETQNVYY